MDLGLSLSSGIYLLYNRGKSFSLSFHICTVGLTLFIPLAIYLLLFLLILFIIIMISFTVLLRRLNEMMDAERIYKVQVMTVMGLTVTIVPF